MEYQKLIKQAQLGMERSYAPYSEFNVGACLVGASGNVYIGCNVENAAFSPSICAERTAFAKAVSEGEHKFTGIAIVGGKKGVITDFCPPCGVCRQVMSEFCDDNFEIVLYNGKYIKIIKLGEIMPYKFGKTNI